MMPKGAGFNVVDLGVDLPVERILDAVEDVKPNILGLSALLTTTMPELRNVIDALESNGLRKKSQGHGRRSARGCRICRED